MNVLFFCQVDFFYFDLYSLHFQFADGPLERHLQMIGVVAAGFPEFVIQEALLYSDFVLLLEQKFQKMEQSVWLLLEQFLDR